MIANCPVCDANKEDVVHALVHCPAAQAAWFASPLCLHSTRIGGGNFGEWYEMLIAIVPKDKLCTIAMIAWGI